MAENMFFNAEILPFCKGCGHTSINENLERALQKSGYSPLDIVIVTDIGCHGIIDKNLYTHTVHGLHGRSVALGSGIAAALGGKKKVIVMVGDGGATIGMQHLIDAAHRNFDMTVFIHNNMLYGMTGGQPSEFTPEGFKTPTNPEGSSKPFYNICQLMVEAGANFVSRINAIGDFSEHLAGAISKKGFSLVEIMELCPSYGMKANPGMKLSKLVEEAGLETKVFADFQKKSFTLNRYSEKPSLLKDSEIVKISYNHKLTRPLSIMLYGSAGGGVQSAAELLATAAVKSGLQVSKKGSYPVTVGIGFSAAEIILSPDEIQYTGSPEPDHSIVLSEDGYNYAKALISKLKSGKIWTDSGIIIEKTGADIDSFNFVERIGSRNAANYSVFYFVSKTNILPIEALIEAYNETRISQKFDVGKLLQFE